MNAASVTSWASRTAEERIADLFNVISQAAPDALSLYHEVTRLDALLQAALT
jgi:hypothetical protein